MERLKSINKSAIFLIVLIFLANIGNVLYAIKETGPSPAFIFTYAIAFFFGMGWWIREDSLKNKTKWVYDIGFSAYIAWPVIIPIYLFKTRGWKALLTIFSFLGIFLGSYVIGIILYLTIKIFTQ